jgi:uncharacterized Zn-finger protein
MSRVDPTAWANKKKAQMENARRLKEERKNAISEDVTFKPQNIARKGSSGPDSLDRLAREVSNTYYDPTDIPLPTLVNKNAYGDNFGVVQQAPSPNSDTLGREMKRLGSSSNVQNAPAPPAANPQYRSKFAQQYANERDDTENTVNALRINNSQQQQADPDEAFFGSLRGGDKSAGPGWNDDTTSNGFASTQPVAGRRGSRPKAVQARQQQQAARRDLDDSAFGNDSYPDEYSAMPPKVTPRAANMGSSSKLTPRTAGEVKSNLSLLKSKMRQSESAGSANKAATISFRQTEPFVTDFATEQRSSRGSDQNSYSYRASPAASAAAPAVNRRGNAARPQPSKPQWNDNEYAEEEQAPPAVSRVRNSRNNPPQQQQSKPSNVRSSYNERPSESYPPQNSRSPQNIDDLPAVASRQSGPAAPSAYPMPSEYPDDIPMDNADEGERQQCPYCPRSFNPIPFEKHVKVCQKVFASKRKVFDSTKMRIQDNPELLKLHKQAQKEEKKAAKQSGGMAATIAAQRQQMAKASSQQQQDVIVMAKGPPPAAARATPVAAVANNINTPIKASGGELPAWKAQSIAFREAMKAARNYSKAVESGAPLPPVQASAPDPSLIPCPHCGRRFSQKAGERHIPQCNNIRAKPSALKRGSGINAANGTVVASGGSGKAKGKRF